MDTYSVYIWHRVSHLLLHWNRILHIDKVWQTANWLLIEARFIPDPNVIESKHARKIWMLVFVAYAGFEFCNIVLRIQRKSIQVKCVRQRLIKSFAIDEQLSTLSRISIPNF